MELHFRPLRSIVTILLAAALLTGCFPFSGSALRSIQPNPQAAAAPLAEAPVQVSVQPTDIPILSAQIAPVALAQPTQAPLRFSLPEPAEAPISLWRPPLYKIPWALGPFDHFYFSRPIAADKVNWPLADYRYGGIFPDTTIVHTGIDIDAPKYTPVLAAADGTVVWAGYGLMYGSRNPKDPYGQAVTIRHDFGYQGQRLYTIYAHMDAIEVQEGQTVSSGQEIGKVGETGNVTGPHLHFEVRIKNNNFYTTLNPELWLAPPQGWGVLVGKLENTNGSLLTSQDVTVRSKDTGRRWVVRSYGPNVVNGDPFYHENMALSDLPAGEYEVIIDYLKDRLTQDITIHPGAITYIFFKGKNGYNLTPPALPKEEAAYNNLPLSSP